MTQVVERLWAPPAQMAENPLQLKPGDRVALMVAHTDDIAVMMANAGGEAIAQVGPDNVFSYVGTDGELGGETDEIRIYRGRRDRARQELARLGGDPDNVRLPDLGDGQLESRFVDLTADIREFVAVQGITAAITLGKNGGEPESRRHSDHVAVHWATLAAAGNVAVWGLNLHGGGRAVIPTDEDRLLRKMHAISASDDQFPMVPYDGQDLPAGWIVRGGYAIPPETAAYLDEYGQYLDSGETYDRYR